MDSKLGHYQLMVIPNPLRFVRFTFGLVRYLRRYLALTVRAGTVWGIRASRPQEFSELIAGTPLKYEALALEAEKERLERVWMGEA